MKRLVLLLPLLVACSGLAKRDDIAARVDAVSQSRLRTHVERLVAIGPRPAGDEAKTEAALCYLEEVLEALGYLAKREWFEARVPVLTREADEAGGFHTVLTTGKARRANLIVEILGQEDPGSVVEVGAHYDTVARSPGANDNASGVAALLEIARVVRDQPCARTLRLVFFGVEEEGFQGSRAHVAALSGEERARFVGMIGLDMVGGASDQPATQESPWSVPFLGWGTTADFVLVLGNMSSGSVGNIFEDAAMTYAPELPIYSLNRIGGWFADGHRSDHVPYWEAGLRALQITDTGEFRSEHYHAASDIPDELDFTFLARVASATAAAAIHLAGPQP